MTFTVEYRGADGAKRTEVVEAASRSEAFAQLGARGIKPTRIAEGGRRPASEKSEPARTPGPLKGAVAGLAVVATAVAVWFVLFPKTDSKPSVPAEPATPAAAPKAERVRPQPTNHIVQAQKAVQPPAAEPVVPAKPARDESLPVSVETNRSGYIIETYVKNGQRTRLIKEPPPVFENPADQVIAWMMAATPGQEIPPFPIDRSIEEDFKRSLTNNLAVLDTDDEKIAALKKSVLETRQELVKLIEQGYTVQQALTEHRKLVNENAKIRTDALKELQQIKAEGDLKGARDYVFKMNVAFQQMGIAPLPEVRDPEDPAPTRAERAAARRAQEEGN